MLSYVQDVPGLLNVNLSHSSGHNLTAAMFKPRQFSACVHYLGADLFLVGVDGCNTCYGWRGQTTVSQGGAGLQRFSKNVH